MLTTHLIVVKWDLLRWSMDQMLLKRDLRWGQELVYHTTFSVMIYLTLTRLILKQEKLWRFQTFLITKEPITSQEHHPSKMLLGLLTGIINQWFNNQITSPISLIISRILHHLKQVGLWKHKSFSNHLLNKPKRGKLSWITTN
jgi:hypothetical protein